jgi:hypothetical protein
MRIPVLAVLAIGTIAAAAPARAQAWDPDYPVCLRVYGPFNYNECRYSSLAQCAATASGRAAQCVVNPFFASAEAPIGRPYRRHRRTY